MSRSGPDSCPHTHEVGAYVLGALDDATAFSEHARTCEPCREELAALAPMSAALAAAAPPVRAPREMQEGIMDRVTAEAELLTAAGPAADRPRRRPRRSARRWALSCAAVGLAVAAALALAFAGGGPAPRLTYATASSSIPGARASLREYGSHAELSVAHMPQPPLGKVYEVWLKRAGASPQPTDALFSVTNEGRGSVNVPSGLRHISVVMVTSEPVGGSTHPTSAPLLTFRLTT